MVAGPEDQVGLAAVGEPGVVEREALPRAVGAGRRDDDGVRRRGEVEATGREIAWRRRHRALEAIGGRPLDPAFDDHLAPGAM